ncbi:MAG: EAL domain-containing protein, partial [Methylobacter sp.]|jgi:diguanylate cyclase (GGDEF)-like protein/PAS domain S-box-containing protein
MNKICKKTFTLLCGLLFCPWAAAEQAVPIHKEEVFDREYIYGLYTDHMQLGLMILLLLLVLLLLVIYLGRTKAALTRSLEQSLQMMQQLKLSTEKLGYMIATSPTVLFAMQVKGNELITHWISDNLTRITGYPIEDAMHPQWWIRHLHEDDRAKVLDESAALFVGKRLTYEYRFVHNDGSVLWIRDEQQLVCDENGKPLEVLGAWTDITEHKLEEISLRIAATAFETKEGIIITDKNKRIVRVNSAFTRLTGYSMEESVGRTPDFLKSGRQGNEFYQAMWQDINQNQYWEGEIWNRRKNGDIYPEWLAITAVMDDRKKVSHYVGAFFDITERKEAEEHIRNLAFYDPLTSLPNRRLMIDRLGIALASSNRNNHYGALMFMDLDRFKILNDTKGHDMGDQLLIEVARRLQASVREGDTVARLGGDEFVVILENLSEIELEAAIQAQAVAEKIRDALAETYWLTPLHSLENTPPLVHHSSASIGLVLFYGHTIGSENLLKRADMAMYQAKHAGRDTIRVFDPGMQTALNERTALEDDLRQALSRNELYLHYQAQVDASGQVVGAEALLRWEQPQRGSVEPTQFIPLAEETGLILQIGHWILQKGCATLAHWAKRPETSQLKLAVNVSARQFKQPDFVEQVRQVLQESGANPGQLKLEITESLIMENLDDTITKMHAIKQLGVGFSMDDFGTGYSSLSYLQRMPLDQLKIDQAFVRDLVEGGHDAAIIRTILALGRSLELTVIAEGVETEVQRNYLAECGCPVFQGYLFSQPVSLTEFERLVHDHPGLAAKQHISSLNGQNSYAI